MCIYVHVCIAQLVGAANEVQDKVCMYVHVKIICPDLQVIWESLLGMYVCMYVYVYVYVYRTTCVHG
jgi:hypothetical protein